MQKFSLIIIFLLISGCSERVKINSAKIGANSEGDCEGLLLSNTPYAGGDGSIDRPYLICTTTQLTAISLRTTDFESSFKLLSDLDMSGVSFGGIGSSATPFKGRFFGNSKTISNLSILRSSGDGVGFFNEVENAFISDTTFSNASISASASNNVGVVTGKAVKSFIKNIQITNASVSGVENTGTLSGMANTSTFMNTTISGTITGEEAVGGAIGTMEESLLLDSDISAVVDSTNYFYAVGGAVGLADIMAGLQKVSFSGTVTGRYSVGGLVGESFADLFIYRSSFTGTVSGYEFAGGVAGTIYRPSSIASVSSNYTLLGNHHLGGLVGEYYGNSYISDVSTSGTITTSGVSQRTVGGFFGSIDDWGNVLNSLGVVTINGSLEEAGGFAGKRFSGADPFTVNDVAIVANINGNSGFDDIGLFTGEGFSPYYSGTSYFWSGGVCDNAGAGNCSVPVQTPVATLSDFYDSSKLPLSNWDFTDLWQTNPGTYPSLRQTQLHTPSVTSGCNPFALKNLPYLCEVSVTDADQHEIQSIDFQNSSTCKGMHALVKTLRGTFADVGSCTLSFKVTDGTLLSSTQTVNMKIQDEITITPSYNPGDYAYDAGSSPVGMGTLTTFTITNIKSDPLTSFSVSGLTEGSYSRIGGTCGASIPASTSCTVMINFTPQSVGLHLDKMQINYTSGSSPITIDYLFFGEGF